MEDFLIEENTKKSFTDGIYSIVYLLFIIISQQWKIIISLILFSLILIPFPNLFGTMIEDYKMATGIVAAFVITPSLMILLVLLPIVWEQISSSSIEKRMMASGVDKRQYSIVIMAMFTLIALVVFYGMFILSCLIYSGNMFKGGPHFLGSFDQEYNSLKEQWMFYNPNIKIITFLILTPISFFGLSACGVLISGIKINSSLKGILTFLGVLYLLMFSRTLLSPMDFVGWDGFDVGNNSFLNTSDVSHARFMDSMFLLISPAGSMVYTIQYGIMGKILTSWSGIRKMAEVSTIAYVNGVNSFGESITTAVVSSHLDMSLVKPSLSAIPTILYSMTWTVLLTLLVLIKPTFKESGWSLSVLKHKQPRKNAQLIYEDSNVLIDIKSLKTSFGKKEKNVVHNDVNFKLNKGEFVSLIGANGAGKTVLAEMIVGIRNIQEGEIIYNNFDPIKDASIQFQSEDNVSEYITPKNLIKFYEIISRSKIDKEEILEIQKIFGVNEFVNVRINKLSGGQRQRLNLMLAMISKPKLLILDEFTTGLDITSIIDIMEYIVNYLKETDSTLIIITHSGKEIKMLSERVLLLKDGVVKELGKTKSIDKKYNGDFDQFMIDNLSNSEFKGIQ